MEIRKTYEKKMCMTELRMTHALYEREHHCDSGSGADTARIVLAVSGQANIRAQDVFLHIDSKKGGLFYIPEGACYHIIWNGTPDIEYYILGIVARNFDTENTDHFGIQQINTSCIDNAEKTVLEIAALFEKGDRASKIRAVGLFCVMYSQIIPILKNEGQSKYHPTLHKAMQYIEDNYNKNFTMEELATEMCISESRLFHLFRSELNTTPIRYRCAIRIEHAASDLRLGIHSLDEISFRCGFKSSAYFREVFRRETGITPGEYRVMIEDE